MRHFQMYGELNVKFKIGDKKEFDLYIPCFAPFKEIAKRFLQHSKYDPELYSFYSNNCSLEKEKALYFTVNNPLEDFVIVCKKNKKVELQETDVYFNQENKITFITSTKINEKKLNQLVALYLSLQPEDLTIKKNKDNKYIVRSDHIIIAKATILGLDKPCDLIFSDHSTVLDLKYLASVYDLNNCSRLFINDKVKESLNRQIVSKTFNKDDPTNKLTFRPYNNQFFYKEDEQSKPKQTTFKGAPIGRNIIRAIAKATKQTLDEANRKILMIEDENGIHLCKIKCAKFVKYLHRPFILFSEVPYKFEIHRNDQSTNQEIYIDPQLCIGQLCQYLSNLPNFVAPYFLKIKNKKGELLDDQLKVEDVSKDLNLIVEIKEPHPVDVAFQLYGNDEKSQILTVDPSESSTSVLKSFAEKLQISPSYIHIFVNNHIISDNIKFIHSYCDGLKYNIASELFVEIIYNDNRKKLVFPLNIEFNFLVIICQQRFGLKDKKIGFIDKSKTIDNDNLLVYSTWERHHIFPGPQYIARYRKGKDFKVQLIMVEKDTYDKYYKRKLGKSTDLNQEVELNVTIYTKEGLLESKVNEKLSEKVKNVIKKLLNHDSQQDSNPIYFILEHELNPDSTVFEIQQIFQNLNTDKSITRPKIISFSSPDMYLYKLPGKSDCQYIVANPMMNLYDLRNKIRKNSQMIIVKYDDHQISNLSQPIVTFNQKKPFTIEYVKELNYNLIYNKSSEEKIEKQQLFDENATILNVLKASCDFLNSQISGTDSGATKGKKGKKSEKANLKLTQIRVKINSVILTKEMEKDLLIDDFGLSGNVEIITLKKVAITIQGENLHLFYFSENDTILYVKKAIMKRLEADEKDAHYYFLLNNQVAANDNDLMSEYLEDEDLCLDIVPIQSTAKVKLIFPEFTHDFVFSKDIIYYDVKEYFAKYYNIDDPDEIELIDTSTNEVIDDNDNPTNNQVIQANINTDSPKLDEKYLTKISQFKEEDIGISEEASIPDNSFICPFTYKSDNELNFKLTLEKTITCVTAKLRVANYLAKLRKGKDEDDTIDFDDIMITINNKEVFAQEKLYDKYKTACNSNPEVRFIINKEVLDMSESNIFLATSKSNALLCSFEVF